jgi:hypothetical protein
MRAGRRTSDSIEYEYGYGFLTGGSKQRRMLVLVQVSKPYEHLGRLGSSLRGVINTASLNLQTETVDGNLGKRSVLCIPLHMEVLTNHGKFNGHRMLLLTYGARLVLAWVYLLRPRIWGPKYTVYGVPLRPKLMMTSATTSTCGTFPRARAVYNFVRILSRGIFLRKWLSKVIADLDPSLSLFFKIAIF